MPCRGRGLDDVSLLGMTSCCRLLLLPRRDNGDAFITFICMLCPPRDYAHHAQAFYIQFSPSCTQFLHPYTSYT